MSKLAVSTCLLAALAASADAAYVMEQIGPPFTIQPIPRNLNTEYSGNPTFSVFAYDDFVIAAAGLVNFVDVDLEANGPVSSSAWPQAVSWRVNVVADQGGSPVNGTLILSVIVPGSSVVSLVKPHKPAILPYVSALVRVPVSLFLAPGIYWVSCTPIEPGSLATSYYVGQSNWTGGAPHNSNSWLHNPGAGFGFVWMPMSRNWPYRVDV